MEDTYYMLSTVLTVMKGSEENNLFSVLRSKNLEGKI